MLKRFFPGRGSPQPCALCWTQWSRIRRLPDTILFSSRAPAGMSILSPWFAMMMTVPWGYRKRKQGFRNLLPGGKGWLEEHSQQYHSQSLNAFDCIVSAHTFGGLVSPEQRFETSITGSSVITTLDPICLQSWRRGCCKGSCHVCLL